MKTNKWSARLGAAVLGLFLVAGAAPAAQGVFDTTASTNPMVVHNYPDEKRVTARVVAITSTGTRAFDTVTFTTIRCGGGGHDG